MNSFDPSRGAKKWLWCRRFERQLGEQTGLLLESHVSAIPDASSRANMGDLAAGLVSMFPADVQELVRERCLHLENIVLAHASLAVQRIQDEQDTRNEKIEGWHSEWRDLRRELNERDMEQHSPRPRDDAQRTEQIQRQEILRLTNRRIARRIRAEMVAGSAAVLGALLIFAFEASQAWLALMAAFFGTSQSIGWALVLQSGGTALAIFVLAHLALRGNRPAWGALIGVVLVIAALRLDLSSLLAGSWLLGGGVVLLLALVSILVPLVGAHLLHIGLRRRERASEFRDASGDEVAKNRAELKTLREQLRARAQDAQRRRRLGQLRRRVEQLERLIRQEQATSRRIARGCLRDARLHLRSEIRQAAHQLATLFVEGRRERSLDREEGTVRELRLGGLAAN